MVRYRLTPRAAQDLDDIGGYIARDNPVTAARFVATLEMRLQLVADHPMAGRARRELSPDLRSIAFRRYVVFYRVRHGTVEIIRIVHGSRDIRRALTER